MVQPPGQSLDVNIRKVAARLPTTYAHVGVYDVHARKPFAARTSGRGAIPAIDQSHASLFRSRRTSPRAATKAASAARPTILVKDRFMCHWFYPPGAHAGAVQGHALDGQEGHLLVRLDPHWSYLRQRLLPTHETAAIEANIAQQMRAAAHLFRLYCRAAPAFPLCLHLVGPRAADSLFYVHRWQPKR